MKRKTRKKILNNRRSLNPDWIREQSGMIAEKLFELEIFQAARTVMFYVSQKSEVNTREMIKRALSGGWKVAVPVAREEGRRLLPIVIEDPEKELFPGSRGILEPEISPNKYLHPRELDLVILPGIAFDLKGNRVGRGAAFYDNFLTAVRPETGKAALAFECQLVESITPSRHDVPMDLIVTEKRVINCFKNKIPPEKFSGRT